MRVVVPSLSPGWTLGCSIDPVATIWQHNAPSAMLALLNLASGHVPPSIQEMAHLHKLQREHAARPARQLTSKTDYTCSDNARSASDSWRVSGTSLGGWLVLEPWLTPSLFYQFLGADETYGPALCRKQASQASPEPVQRAPQAPASLGQSATCAALADRAPPCRPCATLPLGFGGRSVDRRHSAEDRHGPEELLHGARTARGAAWAAPCTTWAAPYTSLHGPHATLHGLHPTLVYVG